MAQGKRKADSVIPDHGQVMAKQQRMTVNGKNQGLPPSPATTTTIARAESKLTKPRRQTQQRQNVSTGSEQTIQKHPMVLQLEQAHDRIVKETMNSIQRGSNAIQQTLANSLETQTQCTNEALRTTMNLFTLDGSRTFHGSGNNSNNASCGRTIALSPTTTTATHSNTTTAVDVELLSALKNIVDEHTNALSRIADESNQWTLQLLSTFSGTCLNAEKALSANSLAMVLYQQQQQQLQQYRGYISTNSGSGLGIPLSPMSPTSPLSSLSATTIEPQQQQQQRHPPFKFDRRATTIRRMLEECQRYKVCKYQDRYLGYDKATKFHSYRAEERYIQARMVVLEEVRYMMETRGMNEGREAEEVAIEWLEKEFLKMDGSTIRFLEILKERQKLRKSQVRRV